MRCSLVSLACASALAAAAAAGTSVEARRPSRQLAPEDFQIINDMLAPLSVVLPPMSLTVYGVELTINNLTCGGAVVSDIGLSTAQIDANTYDINPVVRGVSVSCHGQWGYFIPILNGRGAGTVGMAASDASLEAVLRISPFDYAVVPGAPSPPPSTYHASPCQAASGCNSPCGVTPTDFAAANLLTASPRQW